MNETVYIYLTLHHFLVFMVKSPFNTKDLFSSLPFFSCCGWLGQTVGSQDHLQDAGGEPAHQEETWSPQPGQMSLVAQYKNGLFLLNVLTVLVSEALTALICWKAERFKIDKHVYLFIKFNIYFILFTNVQIFKLNWGWLSHYNKLLALQVFKRVGKPTWMQFNTVICLKHLFFVGFHCSCRIKIVFPLLSRI